MSRGQKTEPDIHSSEYTSSSTGQRRPSSSSHIARPAEPSRLADQWLHETNSTVFFLHLTLVAWLVWRFEPARYNHNHHHHAMRCYLLIPCCHIWLKPASAEQPNMRALCSKIAKLEEELRLCSNALKTLEINEEKVIWRRHIGKRWQTNRTKVPCFVVKSQKCARSLLLPSFSFNIDTTIPPTTTHTRVIIHFNTFIHANFSQ